MARARSKTVSYDVQSSTTGEGRILIERTFVKSTRVAGGYLTANKEYALFDTDGRRYERESASVVICVADGERFRIHGPAEKIRKTGR